jgi:flagellar hook-associated protein 2
MTIMQTNIVGSLGAGSGIDTAALVRDLAAASRDVKVRRFDQLAETNRARISAVAQVRSDLNGFVTSLGALVDGGTLRSQVTVSDDRAMTVATRPGVRIGNTSAEIEITQLARGQTVYSSVVADPLASVGQGGMTLTIGADSFAIAVGAGNDSLLGLAEAINASGSGVSASIVSETSGARLVLKGASGVASGFTLTVDAGADPALNRFATGASGQMTLGQTAQDALFRIDGVAYARASNTVSDTLPGLTLTLKKAEPGTLQTLTASTPVAALKQTLADFVSVFNTLKADLSAARATSGDSALRTFERDLVAIVSTSLTSNTLSKLTDIGIRTTREGGLAIDAAKFDQVLRDTPEAVEAIFNPSRSATQTETTDPGILTALRRIEQAATADAGPLGALKKRLDVAAASIASDRARMEVREDAYRARLERQFGNMDARIAAFRATQSYLEQQVKLWSSDR